MTRLLLKFSKRASGKKSAANAEGIHSAKEVMSQDQLTTLAAQSMLGSSADISTAIRKQTIQATGDARSIVNFGLSKGLDKEQQRAFEVLVASFVLTYYDDATITRRTDEASLPYAK